MKHIVSTLLLVFAVALVKAQVVPPQAFNYSAVARNAEGIPMAETNLGIQISIRQSNPQGNVVYQENHQVETDGFGLFNLAVGKGTIITGSIQGVQWGTDEYYLEVGMDANGGTNFLVMGITQLLSVPYALFAGSAGQIGTGGGALPIPTIHTDAVTGINSNGATFSGSIAGVEASEILELGFVYSTTPNASIGNSKTTVPVEIGAYSKAIGTIPSTPPAPSVLYLLSGTVYYVKAYAKTLNNLVFYGNEETFTTLPTGQAGEGGGLVYYDKGFVSDGWRYLEAKPVDEAGSQWGCLGEEFGANNNGIGLGAGDENTTLIANGCGDATFAAKIVDDIVYGGKDDWYLPTVHELRLMNYNLFQQGLGAFNTSGSGGYWSSVETGTALAFSLGFVLNLSSGSLNSELKMENRRVRAVRAY